MRGRARRPTAVLLAVFLLLPLAGCTGGDREAPAEPTRIEAPTPASGASPNTTGDPVDDSGEDALRSSGWELRDHWAFRSDTVGGFTVVVTGAQDGDWMVDTTSEELALLDARTDLAFVGPIRQGDLAGQQNSSHVKFFDWPLTEGKTWTTTWNGSQRDVTVTRIEEGKAHLTATQDGRVAANYTYNASAHTFGTFESYADNGTVRFAMELVDHGDNFTGTPVRVQEERILSLSSTFGPTPHRQGGSFEVPSWAQRLWIRLGLSCPSGVFELGIGPDPVSTQTDEGYEHKVACPADEGFSETAIENPDPGSNPYGYGLHAASPTGGASYDLGLYARSVEEIDIQPPS